MNHISKTYTMTKFYAALIIAGSFFIYSCKSASKAYQKGDYTNAIELGVKKLQKDPNDYDTREMVQKSYNYEVSKHEDEIRILSNSTSDTRIDQIYQDYSHLQHLYDVIHQYPAVAAVIKTTDYSSYLETYRQKAVEVHTNKAAQWASEGTKQSYREAYKEYCAALNYRADDIDLKRQRDAAFDLAVTKVVISPIQDFGVSQYSSGFQMSNFQNDIIRTLSYAMSSNFVKFYNDFEARTKNITPDNVLELNFSRVTIGIPNDEKTVREISKQVVVKEIVYKPDSVVQQYGTVKANITTTKRTLLSQGDLIITLRDMKGQIVWSDRFTGQKSWQTQLVSYTGDERALSDDDKKQCNQSTYNPPSQEQTLNDLLSQIQSDLSSRLRGYYTSYR